MLRALWIFLPAYAANMAPVFIAKIFPGWTAPVDGGRVGKDGHRLLGAGKTWRGFVGGALLGGMVALGIALVAPWPIPGVLEGWDYGYAPDAPCSDASGDRICQTVLVHPHPPPLIFLFGAVMGFMALVGDAVKSYFKRRMGKESGAPWFPFDQLDFVVFGLLGMLIASPLLPAGWVLHALLDDWVVLATLFVLTPLLHLLVNRLGYWLGLKKVPW